MTIDAATILRAFAGGLMIGGATAVFLLVVGRIAGISGIVGSVLKGHTGPRGAFVVFLVGMLLPALVLGTGPAEFSLGLPGLALAGVLVGVGTQVGSGCTSGHGVCGLANVSPRSLVAVLTFMVTAGITVWVVRHGGVL
ncbi:MAG: hypothetical protein RLZZ403_530 [Pseudomonadota bacterium]|jgi:uncharacterized membrane protein YedE/YeeE